MKSLFHKKVIYTTVIIAVALLLGTAVLFLQPQQLSQPKATIIDQLSNTKLTDSSRHMNQSFIDKTRALLYTHFPEVDYYADNATVENYRNLPSMGYKLILWRAHSALDESGYVAMSTSENNGTSDYPQYSNGELTLCKITGDPKFYFAITPKFISEVMSGRFEDAVIILMSCNGLNEGYKKTAEALKEKGAIAVVSWDQWIESNDNDNAIALLLSYLLNENDTISQAVARVPEQPGPSHLGYFPEDAAGYHIPNYNEKMTASKAGFNAMLNRQQIVTYRSSCAYRKVDRAKWPIASAASKLSETTGYEAVLPSDLAFGVF